jgi:hypothetical protein
VAEAWPSRFRGLLSGIIGRWRPSHGYRERVVASAEARLGVHLPPLLRAYYLTVGRHPLNGAHNRLWPPESLEVYRGRLVFMEDNPGAVFWGVHSRSTAANPVVFQAANREDGAWAAESACSQFLPAMLCWQMVSGGLPHRGRTGALPTPAARRFVRNWCPAGRIRALAAFTAVGQVACILTEGESAFLYVADRSRRGFQELVAALGVPVHQG